MEIMAKKMSQESKLKAIKTRINKFGKYNSSKIVDRSFITKEYCEMMKIKQIEIYKNNLNSGKYNHVLSIPVENREKLLSLYDNFKFPDNYQEYKTKGKPMSKLLYFSKYVVLNNLIEYNIAHSKTMIINVKNCIKKYRPESINLKLPEIKND